MTVFLFPLVHFLYKKRPKSGPSGTRTRDLLNAIETRSQLRYGPKKKVTVDLAGFEPATSSVRLKRAPSCATGPD